MIYISDGAKSFVKTQMSSESSKNSSGRSEIKFSEIRNNQFFS